MKSVVAFAFFALIAVALAKPQEKYTTKYDNVDLNEILKNKRLLSNYVNCLLDKGRCTGDAQELKKILPDAIERGCDKCSQKQKEGSRTVLRHLIDNEPEWWKDLETKYDPSGAYKKKYEEDAKKEGLKL